MRHDLKLIHKILMFVVLPTVLGCVGVIYKDYLATSTLLTRFVRIHSTTELDIQETKIKNFFSAKTAALSFLANQKAIREASTRNDVSSYLANQFFALKEGFHNLILVDQNGHIKASSGDIQVLPNQDLLTKAREFQHSVVITLRRTPDKPALVFIAAPVSNRGVFSGYLGGVVSLTDIEKYIRTQANELSAIPIIFAADNSLISAGMDKVSAASLAPSTTDHVGHERMKALDRYYDVYYRTMSSPDWTIAVAMPVKSLMDPLQRLQVTQGALAVVAIGLSLFGFRRLRQIILKPVTSLIRAHQSVASGNLDIRPDIDEQSEFGAVSKAFNSMSLSLAEVKKKNQRAKKDLLKTLEKIGYANAVKDRFIATVSDELRYPMQEILADIDKVALKEESGNKEYVRILRDSWERLASIITNILSISTIDAAKVRTDKLPLHAWVENRLAEHRDAARMKGLTLRTSYDSALKKCYWGDAERLTRVLDNIVDNAIKFTSEGTVDVKVSVAEHAVEGIEMICFTVSDTGIGFDEDAGKRLFEPFFQVENKFDRKFQGPGLGLPVTQRLLATMGGEIGFESRPGQGSTFWFIVPLLTKE